MASPSANSSASKLRYSNRIRLTAACAFSCYGVSVGRIAPREGPLDPAQMRERVSFELDTAGNK